MPGFEHIEPPGVGRVLSGRYRLVAPIARGGMAEVWEGHDEVLSRPVAVKVLQAHLAVDGIFLERFRREAVTAARLAHPGIVATFDTGLDDGTAFIVMELVRGRNLREWLDSYGRLSPWQAVNVARQVADALAYAHQAGLVHRDVKPANILLIEDDRGGLRVKVTDFGIAKAGIGSGADLTRTGMVLGTPKYLSPEQIRGLDPDARADLYSLGVVLYEMLVGVPPFVGETDMATALAHLGDKVPKPSASVRGLPSGLDRVVVELLAKTPDRRVPSGTELRRRLDALGPLPPPPAGFPPAPPARPSPPPARSPSPSPSQVPPSGPGSPPGGAPLEVTTALASGASPTTALPGGEAGAAGRSGAGPAWGPATQMLEAPPERGRTDQFEMVGSPPVRRFRRSERTAGIVVLALIVAGALVAAGLLLTSSPHHRSPGATTPTVPAGPAVAIAGVTVYLDVGGHTLDNADKTSRAFDGNIKTFWSTDQYRSPTFGNLYKGIGLVIALNAPAHLHTLSVTSPTVGWAASVYVSANRVASGQPLTQWGAPTGQATGIAGNTTFNLAGRSGQYVLLWITNLGPADYAEVAELSVH